MNEALVMQGAEGLGDRAKRAKQIGKGERRAAVDAIESGIVARAFVSDSEKGAEA
jgi:hypothetical protein